MNIKGCLIVSEPSTTPEGWISTVTKDGIVKGPFETIQEAIRCAQTWTASPDPTAPPRPASVAFTEQPVVTDTTPSPADSTSHRP